MTEPVNHHSGWSLVRHGTWEVSIGPDGLIMLPRHLDPLELDDFVEAVTKAATVGSAKQIANQNAQNKHELSGAAGPASTIIVAPAGDDAHRGAVPLQINAPALPEPEAVENRVAPDDRAATLPRPPAQL